MVDKKLLVILFIFAVGVSSVSTYCYFRREPETAPSWTPPGSRFTLYLGNIVGDPPTAFVHKNPKSTWMIGVADISIVVNGAVITFEAPEGQWIILWGVPYMVVSVSSQGVELEPYDPSPTHI